MKKTITTILVALLALSATFTASAAVGDVFDSGIFQFRVLSEDEGTVSLTGHTSDQDLLTGAIEIPEYVTYNDNEYTVTEIGGGAFSECSSLTDITIPPSVTNISISAFYRCTSLTHITIPSSVKIIDSAFSGCTGLKSVDIQEGVTKLYYMTFYGCSSLETIKLPSTVTFLGYGVFQGCTSLTSIELPSELTFISTEVFSGCTGLTSIVIPDKVTEICEEAFKGCENLKTIELGQSLTSIASQYSTNAFLGCPVENLIVNTKNIGDYWFRGMATLKSVTLGNTVESIGESAFENCNIAEISLPKSLVTIGWGAFANNPIEKIYVGTAVDINGVFSYGHLKEAVFRDNAVTIPSFSGATLLSNVQLPTAMETLPDNAFKDCVSLSAIELPPALKEIGSHAFDGCTGFEGFKLPETLTTLGAYAFANCTSMFGVEIPKNITSIGEYAFTNCNRTVTFRLPDNVKSISRGLFYGCSSLEKVYFSEEINSIGSYAFANCPKLRSMMIPDEVKAVPPYMMSGCTSLSEILVPNSIVSIGEGAFYGCSSLINIDLGTGVYDIADRAFEGCGNIKDIHSMALNPPFAERYTFPIEAYNKATVTVQEQSLQRYNAQEPWYRFSNYLTVSGAISLSHYNVDMAGNEAFQLGVYGAKSEIVWTSSNPSVAYANKCGLIVAMGITGSTTITAHVDGEEINCRVTVSAVKRPAKVKALAQEEEEVSEPVDIIIESIEGNPPMVNARLIPVGARTVIDWTSSNDDIATVENGIVTVNGEGEVVFGADTENGLGETLETDTNDIEISRIDNVATDNDIEPSNDVYDLTGRCVIQNATLEQINRLNKGIYIVNGKKILVK